MFCLGLSRNLKNMLSSFLFNLRLWHQWPIPQCTLCAVLTLASCIEQETEAQHLKRFSKHSMHICHTFRFRHQPWHHRPCQLWSLAWSLNERLKLAASNASRSEFAGSPLQDHTLVPSPPPLLVIFLCLAMQFEAASDSAERRTYCTLLKCTLQFLLVQSTPASHITYRELPWPPAATSQIH